MPATYEPIATTTLSSSTASLTFSSISSAYTDLRLVVSALSATGGDTITCYYNGTTGTTLYSWRRMRGNGTTASAVEQTDTDVLFIAGTSGSSSTTIPVLGIVDIFSYTGSKYKTCLISDSSDLNGSGGSTIYVGQWRSTSSITSITIKGSSYNLASGTTATLYGILKA